MAEAIYNRIGIGYRDVRRPDPRIAARVEKALGSARSVLNVGAGTGSYEPAGREVMAVEPSEVMIAQRLEGSAPAIQAHAEALPFDDGSFDAAMAIITVHHWDDSAAGLGEMIRVARERVAVLTFDPAPLRDSWFEEYFPRAIDIHAEFMPPVEELVAALRGATVEVVPLPRRCTDGFFIALWDRPEMHLDPEVRRGSTVWHVMDNAEVERGLDALRVDLESGRWDERYGHLRDETAELDLGLRLLTAELA